MNKEKEANGKIYNILKYYTSTVQYKVNIPCTKLLIGPINLLTTKVMMTMISGKKNMKIYTKTCNVKQTLIYHLENLVYNFNLEWVLNMYWHSPENHASQYYKRWTDKKYIFWNYLIPIIHHSNNWK